MFKQAKEYNGFRKSEYSDVEFLAPQLRFEDKREILSATGQNPFQGLLTSYVQSQFCFTITNKKNVPVGMFGVSKEGAIWLLATDDIKKIKISFMKECRKVVDFFNTKHRILWNYVDCRNELHIRWLKWCGFTFLRKVNYGHLQQPFYEFIKICA